jgi:hypothetical protein
LKKKVKNKKKLDCLKVILKIKIKIKTQNIIIMNSVLDVSSMT